MLEKEAVICDNNDHVKCLFQSPKELVIVFVRILINNSIDLHEVVFWWTCGDYGLTSSVIFNFKCQYCVEFLNVKSKYSMKLKSSKNISNDLWRFLEDGKIVRPCCKSLPRGNQVDGRPLVVVCQISNTEAWNSAPERSSDFSWRWLYKVSVRLFTLARCTYLMGRVIDYEGALSRLAKIEKYEFHVGLVSIDKRSWVIIFKIILDDLYACFLRLWDSALIL